jgi:hypothetical protein
VEKSAATKQITLSVEVQGAAKRRTLDQIAHDRFFDVNFTRSASPTTATAKVQSGDRRPDTQRQAWPLSVAESILDSVLT